MDKSDVEMEDSENHPHDSGSYIKESGNNSKEENFPHATAVVEDAKKSENSGEDPGKQRNESEVSNTATIQMESQINPKNEVNEPMNADGSVDEQINNESKNDLGNNAKESENKLDDNKVEIKQEILPLATAITEDATKIESGREDNHMLRNESKDNKLVTSLMESQINHTNEVNGPMNSESKNYLRIYIKESENKLDDSKVEIRQEISPLATAVPEDAKKIENGGEVLNLLRYEPKYDTIVMSLMEGQISTNGEASEPMTAERSVEEQISTKSKNEDIIYSKYKDQEQIATRNAVDEQANVMTEAVEQNSTIGGFKEEKSTGKGMDCGNYANNVKKEKSSEDKAEKPEQIGVADANPAGHVAVEQKATEIVDAGNSCGENSQHPNKTSAIAEEQKTTEIVDAVNNCCEHRELTNKSLAISVELVATEIVDAGNNSNENKQLTKSSSNEAPTSQKYNEYGEMEDVLNVNEGKEIKDELKDQSKEAAVTDGNTRNVEAVAKHAGDNASFLIQQEPLTPDPLVKLLPAKAEDHGGETVETVFTGAILQPMAEGDDGAPEEQVTFIKELESFYRERAMDFKPLKFYGEPLNCLKLWNSVIRLGGYDRVTGYKLWRQVGESFNPPKTCTTVSWTFRIFYEKSLLEYERHKTQSSELQLPGVMPTEVSGVDGEGNGQKGSGSGRARRDAASRAMQGWHTRHLSGHNESGERIIKDKSPSNVAICEKSIKRIGSFKQKRPNVVDHSIKAARTETSKQLLTPVVDVGPSADWVKINVRETRDCFEVYALVPGLLREEVRVQADPAGRLVITGQPQQADNPWGVAPFKKIISFPARINPLQTSAVISMHGRLFVRVPFEQSKISS